MFDSITTDQFLIILGGYALISYLCYNWGKKAGIMLGTHTTIMMLLVQGFLATKDGRFEGTSEFIKHPDAKPEEMFNGQGS